MGLFERVQRQVIARGLIPKVISLLPLISTLCIVLGIVIIGILPFEGQYRNTYISENALMPSQAYSYFRESEWNIVRGYRSQIVELRNASAVERNAIMSEWLQQFGTKTDIYQNHETGDTLYGVFHAPRGDGTESMVLAIPWFNADGEFNVNGAALGVALARYFSRWPVWSKNIIVVFTENPKAALRSWVEAYHTSLDLTGGSIEAAIVLDFAGEGDLFDYMEIYYDGLNGELPNLDMVNIGVFTAEHEGMKVSLHGTPFDKIKEDTLFSRLKILMSSIKNSALSGVKKTYGNEAFSGWRIQSVTLRARGQNGPFDVTSFGRVPEAMFRSINNLLEKFHQSFFFYLMLAPRHFVSISSYLPSTVAISIGFALASLNSYFNNPYYTLPFFSLYTLLSILFWFVSLVVTFIVSNIFIYSPFPTILLAVNIIICLYPAILKGNAFMKDLLSYRLRSTAFLFMSLLLTSLLMVNFPLAFGMGLLSFPMTQVKTITSDTPTISRTRVKNSVLLLVSNPFIATWLFSLLCDNEFSGLDVFERLVSASRELGCWTWLVLCVGWWTPWLLVAISALDTVKLSNDSEDFKKQQ
ncbi:hypothetical protein NCAS_0B03860 [Naumovozyma castellii]|uniref:GPI transamidase component GAA1 n=1 Tax=Naumovozyma castellii TaxID=27288 RepID=G0V9Y5_NAUCA|nr:hypothetical protein NCAS_0B03860 [Naumovozyma castellii CBS 4309]CCC68470.1 hypothetical protein NCAS_0B03860 [Naumovozyma castellii CBS 4309]